MVCYDKVYYFLGDIPLMILGNFDDFGEVLLVYHIHHYTLLERKVFILVTMCGRTKLNHSEYLFLFMCANLILIHDGSYGCLFSYVCNFFMQSIKNKKQKRGKCFGKISQHNNTSV